MECRQVYWEGVLQNAWCLAWEGCATGSVPSSRLGCSCFLLCMAVEEDIECSFKGGGETKGTKEKVVVVCSVCSFCFLVWKHAMWTLMVCDPPSQTLLLSHDTKQPLCPWPTFVILGRMRKQGAYQATQWVAFFSRTMIGLVGHTLWEPVLSLAYLEKSLLRCHSSEV